MGGTYSRNQDLFVLSRDTKREGTHVEEESQCWGAVHKEEGLQVGDGVRS